MFFSICCCLLYVLWMLWLVSYICFSLLVAIMQNVFCSLVSSFQLSPFQG
jgi:hypothetical protein